MIRWLWSVKANCVSLIWVIDQVTSCFSLKHRDRLHFLENMLPCFFVVVNLIFMPLFNKVPTSLYRTLNGSGTKGSFDVLAASCLRCCDCHKGLFIAAAAGPLCPHTQPAVITNTPLISLVFIPCLTPLVCVCALEPLSLLQITDTVLAHLPGCNHRILPVYLCLHVDCGCLSRSALQRLSFQAVCLCLINGSLCTTPLSLSVIRNVKNTVLYHAH